MCLSEAEITAFIRDGFVAVRGAVDRATIDECRMQLWDLIPESPEDPVTWTEPVRWVQSPMTAAFRRAAAAPRLIAACDQLVGTGRWKQRGELGNIPVRFPAGKDSHDTGWHFDASYQVPGEDHYFANVSSRDRGLLMLFLISDVSTDDAPTRIRVGSHIDVARALRPYGEAGADMFRVCGEMSRAGTLESAERAEVLATGNAGDILLCHPFLIHAAQLHHGRTPRFMSQPGLDLSEQFDLTKPRCPVEYAVTRAHTWLLRSRPAADQGSVQGAQDLGDVRTTA